MSDIFNWLSGLEPGPWSLLLVGFVGLLLLAGWLSHLYCQYRKDIKAREDQRLSQSQAWNQAMEAQEAVLSRIIGSTRSGAIETKDRKRTEAGDSEDDSPTSH